MGLLSQVSGFERNPRVGGPQSRVAGKRMRRKKKRTLRRKRKRVAKRRRIKYSKCAEHGIST